MQCVYISERIGKVYEGIITSVTDFGVFVEIFETKCDGLIKLANVGSDTYTVDLNNHTLKGFNTGDTIRLGDIVHVIVSSVDIEKKNINLEMIRF